MLRRAVPLAVVLLLSTAALPVPAGSAYAANGADFTLEKPNRLSNGRSLRQPALKLPLGQGRHGQDTLDAGQSVNITFPRNNTACTFDILVKCHDNDVKAE